MRKIQTLLVGVLALTACNKDEADPFRVVPVAGDLKLHVDHTTTDNGQVIRGKVCGTDHEGFPVANNTAIFVHASDGQLVDPDTEDLTADEDEFDDDILYVEPRPVATVNGCAPFAFIVTAPVQEVEISAWSGAKHDETKTLKVTQWPANVEVSTTPSADSETARSLDIWTLDRFGQRISDLEFSATLEADGQRQRVMFSDAGEMTIDPHDLACVLSVIVRVHRRGEPLEHTFAWDQDCEETEVELEESDSDSDGADSDSAGGVE